MNWQFFIKWDVITGSFSLALYTMNYCTKNKETTTSKTTMKKKEKRKKDVRKIISRFYLKNTSFSTKPTYDSRVDSCFQDLLEP